jgi:ketosteroid isomerase-like protein
MNADAIRALAMRFFDAIERGDLEAVQAIYAPDAVI